MSWTRLNVNSGAKIRAVDATTHSMQNNGQQRGSRLRVFELVRRAECRSFEAEKGKKEVEVRSHEATLDEPDPI